MRVKIPLAALGAAVAIVAGGCLGGGGAVNPPASSAVGPSESAAENPGGGLLIHGEPGNPCDRLMSATEANQASGLTGFATPMDFTTVPIYSLDCSYYDVTDSVLHVFLYGDTLYQSGHDYMRAYTCACGGAADWGPVPVEGLGVAAVWLGTAAEDQANTLWIDTGRAVVDIALGQHGQNWHGADPRTVAEAVAHIILPRVDSVLDLVKNLPAAPSF
jgi:hypothetical protein